MPLTVYQSGRRYVLLDGERRWRCALKLRLQEVPVIVQPEPDRMTNIMMMFAIHNARKDWDALPTAYKLQALQEEFNARHQRYPNESELAELSSISRSEVRRLLSLLALPQDYRDELMAELEKPRTEQVLSVDLVLETTRGARALLQRDIITKKEEDGLRRAIIAKFRTGVINNTVAPRQLARMARAVDRGDVERSRARTAVRRLINDERFSIDDAFAASAASVDYAHGIEQQADRLIAHLSELRERGYEMTETLRAKLMELQRELRRALHT